MSANEDKMMTFLIAEGIPADAMIRELKFALPRRWRFDIAIPVKDIAVEIDGGIGFGGRSRHTEPGGFTRDCTKLSVAAAKGWQVFRSTGATGHMRKIARIIGHYYRDEQLPEELLETL